MGRNRCLQVVGGTAVLAAVLTVPFAQAQEQVEPKPSFRVEAESVDVGDVRAGTDAVATFVFHNDGDKDVKIIKAKPS
jgi:hypothetical protein